MLTVRAEKLKLTIPFAKKTNKVVSLLRAAIIEHPRTLNHIGHYTDVRVCLLKYWDRLGNAVIGGQRKPISSPNCL